MESTELFLLMKKATKSDREEYFLHQQIFRELPHFMGDKKKKDPEQSAALNLFL